MASGVSEGRLKRDIALGLTVFLVVWLSIAGCAGVRKLLGDSDPAPSGRYESLPIRGGSLLVSRGECSYPDLDILQRRANAAIENMRAAWPNRPNVAVHSLPVSFSRDPWAGAIQATGIYHPDGRWIELRCDFEHVIEHELYHALGHQMRLPCYATIGHGHNLDCST